MKNLSLLLVLPLFLSLTAYSQVTNLVVNGQTSNFTMASGDQISWAYNVPNPGDSTLIEIWVDADQNGILNPAVDVLWNCMVQIDGDTKGQNGVPDMDGLANGYVSIQANVGLAPAHYIMVFKNHNNYKYIAGTVTNLVSPVFTISGTVTVPSGFSKQNIMLSLGTSGKNGTFWNALTDINGNFSIKMNSDTSGNPWYLGTDNNTMLFGSAIVSPAHLPLVINPNTSIYTGNNFTVTNSSASIKGTLKDENGNPFVNADVQINGNNGNMNRNAKTDTVGAFQIGLLATELPQSDLSLFAGNPQDQTIVQAFYNFPSVNTGNVLTHNLIVYKTNSTISGRATFNGNPTNFTLGLNAVNSDSGMVSTFTDVNGYFTFHVSNKIYNYTIYSSAPIGPNYNYASIIAHPGQTNANLNFPLTDVKPDDSNIPTTFTLSQNYPNPFNPSTFITYQIPTDAFVTLKIFNLLGNEIKTLENGLTPAGSHQVQFNANGLSSGVYFYTIQANSLDGKQTFRNTKKMILMK